MRYSSTTRDRYARRAIAILVVASAACSPDVATSPRPRTETAALGITEAAKAGAPSALLSNRFAYVWADQPTLASYTPSPAYSYNATGGTIQINRTASGTYIVLLTSPSGWTGSTIGVAVTAYGSLGAQCSIMYQVVNGMTLEVGVQCFDFVTHLNVASQFTLLVVGSGSLTPRSAFAFGNQPSAPSYTPNPLASYTSGPGPMVITHNAPAGSYNVNLGTGLQRGTTFMVSAIAGFWNLCKIGQWAASAAEVRCFDYAGAPKDSPFWILQVEGGRPGRRLGFAFAHLLTTPSYTPNPALSFNSSGGAITATRLSAGRYTIEFAGLQKFAGHTENVQLTPRGSGVSLCGVVAWVNSATGLRVVVECRNKNGVFTDSRYDVLVIE